MNIEKFIMTYLTKKNIYLLTLITLFIYCHLSNSQKLKLSNEIWSIYIETDNLELIAEPNKSIKTILNHPVIQGNSQKVQVKNNKAYWEIPKYKLTIQAELKENDLHLKISSDINQKLPIFEYHPDQDHQGYIVPFFEGLYVPDNNSLWQEIILNNHQQGDTTSSLSIPLIGIVKKNYIFNYIFISPYNNKYFWSKLNNGLKLLFEHNFTALEPYLAFELLINLSEKNLLSGAKRYRKILKKANQFVSLKDKIKQNPDTKKLIGASHMYLWGDTLLSHHNVKNWDNFISTLNLDTSIPSKIRASFSPEAKQILKNREPINEQQKNLIISELDESIKNISQNIDERKIILEELFGDNISKKSNWGDGLSVQMIKLLNKAGLRKLWLGFGSLQNGINHSEAIKYAKKLGYLIGPSYLPYNVYLQQKTSSIRTNLENYIYKACSISTKDNRQQSIENKKIYLNPHCTESYERNEILRMQRKLKVNSWYIKQNGMGVVLNDYNKKHPISQKGYAKTINNKFYWLINNFQIVVGSTNGNAVTAKNLSFAHGVQTPYFGEKDDALIQKNSKFFLGDLYPKYMPSLFFKQSILKEKYKHTYFNPLFRIPLYQAVFHDSVITSHHPNFSNFKFSNIQEINTILHLLYNTPPLYHLNLTTIKEKLPKIKKIDKFFRTIHAKLATLALTEFNYLSADQLVQKTTFRDQSIIIANFSDAERKYKKIKLPPYSVTAILAGKNHKPLQLLASKM